MDVKERLLNAFMKRPVDKIPWLDAYGLAGRGQVEREARNMGMGIWWSRFLYDTELPNVTVEERMKDGIIRRTYHSPKGSVSTKFRMTHGFGVSAGTPASRWFTNGFGPPDPWPWIIEYLIKEPSDYEAVRFMVEDAVLTPNYEPFKRAEESLGSDGVVLARVEKSPIQKMFIQLMGVRTFALHYYKYRDKFDELRQAIEDKDDEAWRIAARSPAKIVHLPENLDGVIISPQIFERYHLPYYNKYASMMHESGKIVTAHMDGRLKSLAHLIGKTGIDAIDAFTPPPTGDLSIAEAKEIWKNKFALFINFPVSIYMLGEKETRRYMAELLSSIAPGYGFIIGMTEDVPHHLIPMATRVIGSALQDAYIPLPSNPRRTGEETD